MKEGQSRTEELIQEVKWLRHEIRRAAYVIAGGLVLSSLIVVAFFAPGGEIIWTLAVVAATVWALAVFIGSALTRLSDYRTAAKRDRERMAALSGRAIHFGRSESD